MRINHRGIATVCSVIIVLFNLTSGQAGNQGPSLDQTLNYIRDKVENCFDNTFAESVGIGKAQSRSVRISDDVMIVTDRRVFKGDQLLVVVRVPLGSLRSAEVTRGKITYDGVFARYQTRVQLDLNNAPVVVKYQSNSDKSYDDDVEYTWYCGYRPINDAEEQARRLANAFNHLAELYRGTNARDPFR